MIEKQILSILNCWRLQGVKRLFLLSFENNNNRIVYARYFLLKAEVKDYNFMIYGQCFFDRPVKYGMTTYENIWNLKVV